MFHLIEKESDLQELIRRADPSLRECKDSLEVAKRLLALVYQITVFPYGDRKTTDVDHNLVSAQEYYEQVIRKYAPVLCGGINTFFCKILQEMFKMDAFVINMGLPETSKTHVVAIVLWNNRFYLFDAHYGSFFTGLDWKMLDLESVFMGTPFILNFLNWDKKFVLDVLKNSSVYEEIEKGKSVLIDAMQKVYQYAPRASAFKNNFFLLSEQHKFQQCTWQETCVLQYLEFGSLLGLSSPSKETGEKFTEMLARYQIRF